MDHRHSMCRMQSDNPYDVTGANRGGSAKSLTAATSPGANASPGSDSGTGVERSSDDACRHAGKCGSEFLAICTNATIRGFRTTRAHAAAGDAAATGGHGRRPI